MPGKDHKQEIALKEYGHLKCQAPAKHINNKKNLEINVVFYYLNEKSEQRYGIFIFTDKKL